MFFYSPKLTKNGEIIALHKFKDSDNFNIVESFKSDTITSDIVHTSMFHDKIPENEINIIDGSGVSMKHVFKVSFFSSFMIFFM